MDNNLEKKLVEKYPKLYRDYGGDPRETCMTWGFSCGDGWYSIIEELSEKIAELDKDNQVVADQVKEKFAGLRFYYHIEGENNSLFDKVEKLIAKAEAKSFKTCERCGKPGSVKGKYWVTTMCDSCWELARIGPIV